MTATPSPRQFAWNEYGRQLFNTRPFEEWLQYMHESLGMYSYYGHNKKNLFLFVSPLLSLRAHSERLNTFHTFPKQVEVNFTISIKEIQKLTYSNSPSLSQVTLSALSLFYRLSDFLLNS